MRDKFWIHNALIFTLSNKSELQGYLSATRGRVGRYMALIQAASDVHEQGAVDDRDTLLHAIRDLLSIYSNVQAGLSTYVSAPGIVQQISALHSELRTLESDLEHTLPADRNRCINDLSILLQRLQQLLFASSTTAQPILSSRLVVSYLTDFMFPYWPHLMSASILLFRMDLDDMEKANAKLSTTVEEVTVEHCNKNEIEKHHSQEIAHQRRVFVDFFCNPERLRNQVRELTARLRALQAS
ncbi:hypothetical protein LIER_40526 [Lithospermum erythrorhizon]|uniref:Uncharacterized protein n=1 Tax=Lithospermum erythrorhizon TaxID=34254 RepID=A0AAV3QVV0_LITER